MEVGDVDHPLALGSAHDEVGPQRGADRRQVLRRIGLAQRPADRAAVTDHRVSDHDLGLGEDGEDLCEQLGLQQFHVPGQRPDPDLITSRRM